MTNDRPIFVVGCPRSGTTMLQLMLHAHPRIAIPPETRFLLETYRERRRFGDLRRPANRRALAHFIVNRPQTRFFDLGLDGPEMIAEIVAGPPTLGSALGSIFRAYSDRFDKPRWGDKRPAYLNNLDVVLRLFPDAQIVHIVRDGRDCVASLQEMPWHRTGIYHSIAAWAQAVDNARLARRRLAADSFYELRYEDLVVDPARELSALCDFLGEEYDEAMTRPAELATTAVPAYKTWHERTHRPVDDGRVGSWKQRLTDAEIALCEVLLADRLNAYGFDVSGGGRIKPADRLRFERIAARHRLAGPRRALARATDRLRGLPPPAALLTSGQRRAWRGDRSLVKTSGR
ncbi:MAG TPA: sulfotransferase [Micromonosporaceae bacterium]|nr:sulfotransferase [Micromonosporaceae bacterium]